MLKIDLGKVITCFKKSRMFIFICGIIFAVTPLIIIYGIQKIDNRPKPSVQLVDIDLSFSVNDKVTYPSEEFKIPKFLFEGVTGNYYTYSLPKLNQSIQYKDLRNYFISSHNFNMAQPDDIKAMMTKYAKIYSRLEASRDIEVDEIDNLFRFFTTYGYRIFNEFSKFVYYSTDTEIDEYFKTSELFSIVKDEKYLKDKPNKMGVDIQKQLTNKHLYFKYYDFINENILGWKILSDNTESLYTVSLGNYIKEKEKIKYYKFFTYSLIFYDKDSLRLIFDLLYKRYSDVDKIRKKIMDSESVNSEMMKYFSRFKASVLCLNKGKTPITFMPNSTLIVENPSPFSYYSDDGDGCKKKKTLPKEIRIDLTYYESFKTISPFRL